MRRARVQFLLEAELHKNHFWSNLVSIETQNTKGITHPAAQEVMGYKYLVDNYLT